MFCLCNTKTFSMLFVFLFATIAVLASYFTQWTEYSVNPAFDPANAAFRAYYPIVLYDSSGFSGHGTTAYYKMWFAQNNGIAYAYSDDGISWTEYNNSNPLAGLAVNANHPVVIYDTGGFGGSAAYYKIWYWDGVAGPATSLHYAESADGITWVNDQPIQQHATNTALQLIAGWGIYNNYFYHMYGPGYVLYNPAGANIGSATPDDKSDDQPMTYRYVMYYDSSSEGTSPEGSAEQTSLAYSTNGIYWIRYGDVPVMIPSGNAADWDGEYSFRVSVIRVGGTYHMWYSGANADNSIGTYYAHGIGHATSTDGLNWTRDSDNPALHVTDGIAWRNNRSYTPCVLYNASSFSGHGDAYPYKMWFSGRDAATGNYAIGYAWLLLLSNIPPTADFTPKFSEGYAPLTVNFDASISSDPDSPITAYNWNFGDGTTGAGITASHTYSSIGTYIVTLTVIDSTNLIDRAQGTVNVLWPLIACFTATPTSGFAMLTVNLDASCSADLNGGKITSYCWDLGNGFTMEGKNVTSTYTDEGSYTITLTITDNYGFSQKKSIVISVKVVYPPTGIRLERLINRSLFREEAFHILYWEANPKNEGLNIAEYRIYRKLASEPDSAYKLIGAVSGSTFTYTNPRLPVDIKYTYVVKSLESSGHESITSPPVENEID